jgi:hypothetical protein
LQDQVWQAYRRGFSIPGDGIAQKSALLALLEQPAGHNGVVLDPDSRVRLVTWMDTYAQLLGHFSDDQERELLELRRAAASLFDKPAAKETSLMMDRGALRLELGLRTPEDRRPD